MHYVGFEGSLMWKQAGKGELKSVDITQTVILQHFYSVETALCMYFTVLKNVTIWKEQK